MNRCPRCGEQVAPNFVVCHGCGFVPSSAPEEFRLQAATDRPAPSLAPSTVLNEEEDGGIAVKEPVLLEDDNQFNEYVLPWILIVVGLIPNVIFSVQQAGALGPVAIAIDLVFLLAVQIPLTAAVMMLTGTLFGISFGWLSTGIVKLAAISLFSRGLMAAAYLLFSADQQAAAIALGIFGVLTPLWLFTSLFELEFFETLVSVIIVGVTLGVLQGLAIFILLRWLIPALVG